MSGSKQPDRLVAALRALLRRKRAASLAPAGVDTRPGCAFGAVADQRLQEVERGLREIRARVWGLILMALAAVAGEVAARLLG